MAIHIDIIAELREIELRRAARRLKAEAERLGTDMSKIIDRGFDTTKAVKSLDRETDALVNLRDAWSRYDKVIKNTNSTAGQQRKAMEDLAKAVRGADAASISFTETTEREIKRTRDNIEVIDANTKAFKDFRAEMENSRAEIGKVRQANTALIDSNKTLTRSFDQVTDANAKTTREQDKYNRMVADGVSSRETLIRQSNSVRDSYTKEQRAIRDATMALSDHEEAQRKQAQRDAQRASSRRKNNLHPGAWAARNLGALTPLGVVTPTLVLPLGIAFTQVANAAVAASQAVALLPAALTAGAAAMGTIKMATSGFADTIGALAEGDLEKFAENIQKLSPNAQQAALSIQNLFPLLRDLQQNVQDAFFTDAGEMIHNLVGTYEPVIRNMTVGIASTMNQGMKLVFDQLMTPQVQGDIVAITNNIVSSFRALLPAIQPLTQAFTDLTAVGSSILPGMASDMAEVARSFADFIGKARESGELEKFMTTGWEAIKAVGSVILDFGQMLYDVFGLKSQADIDAFKETMRDFTDVVGLLLSTMKILFTDIGNAARAVWNFLAPVNGAIESVGGLEQILASLIEIYLGARLITGLAKAATAFGTFGRAATETADVVAAAGTKAGTGFAANLATALRAFGWAALGVIIAKEITDSINANIQANKFTNAPDVYGDESGRMTPWEWMNRAEAGTGELERRQNYLRSALPNWSQQDLLDKEFTPPWGAPGKPATADELGAGMEATRPGYNGPHGTRGPAGPPPGPGVPGAYPGPFAVPPPPPEDGNKPSESDILDAAMAALDPSQYRVDPYGGAGPPGAANPYAMIGAPPPGTSPFERGYYEAVDPQKLIEADRKVQTAAHDLEEDRKKRLALEQTGLGSAEEINDAKWKELEDQWKLQSAQADLVEAQQGTWKKLYDVADEYTSLMEGIGAGLDKDFGISKGLPGIADNLVRFIGALATAPMMSHLAMISAAQGGPARTGSGLIGIAAQQGAFGPQYTLEGQIAAEMAENGVSPSAMPPGIAPASYPGSTVPGSGPYSSDAALLANVPAGQYTQEARGDLTQGLADCSSAVEDLVNLMDGRPTAGASMYTGNAAQWLTERGFLPGRGGPGDFRVGFNSGHMQATLPGGTPFNWGSSEAAAAGGRDGSLGADDPSFTDHYYRPAGYSGGPAGSPATPGGFSSLSTPFGSIPIPLPVTIVGGAMGGGGGGGLPFPGMPPGLATSPTSGSPSGTNWEAIMQAEAGGDGGWQANTGNGFYGGLQFLQSTWDQFKLPGMPGRADLATKEQQIAVAERVLAAQGPGAWPNTYHLGAPNKHGPTNPANPAAPANRPAPPFQTGTFDGPFPEWLPPGTTVAQNNTGRPQQVLPPGFPTIMGPNVGMPGGGPPPGPPPPQYGGVSQPSIPGGSAASGGGVAGAAAGALDMMMPGAGAAASLAMQEISRAIKYGGQLAGIGVQGLMETFLPTGGSELANSNWITRIAGAAAGMAPQLPNIAGKATAEGLSGMAQQQAQLPMMQAPQPVPGATNQTGVHIENYNVVSTEDRAGQDLARWNMPGKR